MHFDTTFPCAQLKAVDLDQDGKFTMAEFVSAMFDRVYDGEPGKPRRIRLVFLVLHIF